MAGLLLLLLLVALFQRSGRMKRESGRRGQCALIARVPVIHYTMMMAAAQIYDPPFRPYVYVPPVYSVHNNRPRRSWAVVYRFSRLAVKEDNLAAVKDDCRAFLFPPFIFSLSLVRSFSGRALDGGWFWPPQREFPHGDKKRDDFHSNKKDVAKQLLMTTQHSTHTAKGMQICLRGKEEEGDSITRRKKNGRQLRDHQSIRKRKGEKDESLRAQKKTTTPPIPFFLRPKKQQQQNSMAGGGDRTSKRLFRRRNSSNSEITLKDVKRITSSSLYRLKRKD